MQLLSTRKHTRVIILYIIINAICDCTWATYTSFVLRTYAFKRRLLPQYIGGTGGSGYQNL